MKQSQRPNFWKRLAGCCWLTLFIAYLWGAEATTLGGGAPTCALTLVNYSSKPIYATSVTIPAKAIFDHLGVGDKTPLEAVTGEELLPVIPGMENGVKVMRLYLSMRGSERLQLNLRVAKPTTAVEQVGSALFETPTGEGKISNGVLEFKLSKGEWSLAFSGPHSNRITSPNETVMIQHGRMDYWLDNDMRGRLMGITDEKVAALGLLRSTEAKISGGRAKLDEDGTATLTIERHFKGFGEHVHWEESYTLKPGQPVLTYKSRWSCTDDRERYLAYVGIGGGVHGSYGPLLQGKLRFKYENPGSGDYLEGMNEGTDKTNPSEGSRILLSGKNNSYTRIGWRGERCWVGVDSDLGCGLGVSTLKPVVREIPGNSVWSFSNSDFFARLLDDEQENQPYMFSQKKPLELGFAFVATCAEVGIWNQTRNLFRSATRNQSLTINSSCAVYLNGQPLQYGELRNLNVNNQSEQLLVQHSSQSLAAFTLDAKRAYTLTGTATGASEKEPLQISVRSSVKPEEKINLLSLTNDLPQSVDFTKVTQSLNTRQSFVLEISGNTKRLSQLSLEPAAFNPPPLHVPADGLSLTDIGTYFRWYQIKGALDYEIQLATTKDFVQPTKFFVRSEVAMPYYLPKDDELPTVGKWFWRVRAVEIERTGQWSMVRSFTVNKQLDKLPVAFKISPSQPIFTMEGCRVPDWSRFKNTLPEDLKANVVFNTGVYGTEDHLAYFKPLKEMNQPVFLRTHGPSSMFYWSALSMVEELFQTYPNIIGIMAGETLSTHFHGGDSQTYVNRLLKLCGKYGRIYYDADGSYPNESKYQSLYEKEAKIMGEYKDYLIFAQKNNILHRQFASQSSVLGLYLANDIIAQGAWEDGGWYWQQTGFRKLGEIRGQRGGDVTNMPRIFWTLNYAMGLGRGCSVFSFEGQVGTTPVPQGWKLAENEDWPKTAVGPYRNPAAFWTTDGELTPTFHRFCLPFMRAVIQHGLVPTKAEVLRNIKLAVVNDGVKKKEDGDQYYYEWEALYRGTYGFRDFGVIPGTLMEFFPNTGRYNYFPVLPQGQRELGKGIQVLPLSQLDEVSKVKGVFNAAYPEWYTGTALVNIVGDTLTVLNGNENIDEVQDYSVPLKDRGPLGNISGEVQPHSYVIGKLGPESLWIQANTEYPERDTELVLTWSTLPQVTITPASAAKRNQWDATTKKLSLTLSHREGAVEVKVK